jgi:tellurite resistance protein
MSMLAVAVAVALAGGEISHAEQVSQEVTEFGQDAVE